MFSVFVFNHIIAFDILYTVVQYDNDLSFTTMYV